MPALEKKSEEAFCQFIVRGMLAPEAYEAAGYKPSQSNAYKFAKKHHIQRRIAEIVGQLQEQMQKETMFNARWMLDRLNSLIDQTIEPAPQVAADIAKHMTVMLGYASSAKYARRELFNEIDEDDAKQERDGPQKPPEPANNEAVSSFAAAAARLRKPAS